MREETSGELRSGADRWQSSIGIGSGGRSNCWPKPAPIGRPWDAAQQRASVDDPQFLLKITPASWDPATDSRTPVWEVTQHLIKRLDDGGEQAAADLLRHVLAYRLCSICERKKWAKDALGFNALVTSWPAIARLTSSQDQNSATQETMFP